MGEDAERGPKEGAEVKKALWIRAQIFHKQNHILDSGTFIPLETIICVSGT